MGSGGGWCDSEGGRRRGHGLKYLYLYIHTHIYIYLWYTPQPREAVGEERQRRNLLHRLFLPLTVVRALVAVAAVPGA